MSVATCQRLAQRANPPLMDCTRGLLASGRTRKRQLRPTRPGHQPRYSQVPAGHNQLSLGQPSSGQPSSGQYPCTADRVLHHRSNQTFEEGTMPWLKALELHSQSTTILLLVLLGWLGARYLYLPPHLSCSSNGQTQTPCSLGRQPASRHASSPRAQLPTRAWGPTVVFLALFQRSLATDAYRLKHHHLAALPPCTCGLAPETHVQPKAMRQKRAECCCGTPLHPLQGANSATAAAAALRYLHSKTCESKDPPGWTSLGAESLPQQKPAAPSRWRKPQAPMMVSLDRSCILQPRRLA
mmetsp:Transcript_14194/g.31535  ORF Transcript_14194/g.31535 Transcript_14194/m.31535 type:complete len:297 (+) Transcript_14194:747-1637(+)